MKRSDMIKEIQYLFDSNHPIGVCDYKRLSEEILKCCEDKGMPPPPTDNSKKIYWIRFYSTLHHKWEE